MRGEYSSCPHWESFRPTVLVGFLMPLHSYSLENSSRGGTSIGTSWYFQFLLLWGCTGENVAPLEIDVILWKELKYERMSIVDYIVMFTIDR